MNAFEYQQEVIAGMKMTPEEIDELVCPAFVAFVNAFYASERPVEECVETNNKVCSGMKPQVHHLAGFILNTTHRFYGMYGFDMRDSEEAEVMVHDDNFCLANFLIALYFLDTSPEKAAQLTHTFHFAPSLEARKDN